MLVTLKDKKQSDKEKKKETEALLGVTLPEERFALLTNLGKKITDFDLEPSKIEAGAEKGDIDETYGINVQFQESDEEEVDGDDDDDDDSDPEAGEITTGSSKGLHSGTGNYDFKDGASKVRFTFYDSTQLETDFLTRVSILMPSISPQRTLRT